MMGNEQGFQQRHVSFGNNEFGGPPPYRAPNLDRSFQSRDSYNVGPQMRTRESTFSSGQRIQPQMPVDQWNGRPMGGGRTTTTTRQEWQGGYGDRQPDYFGEEEDWRRRQNPYTQRSTYTSTSERRRPNEEDSWQQTSRYNPQRPGQSSFSRSYQTDNYPNDYPNNRAFNTRDNDDPWYNYNPVVNKKADWALVGRHVLSPPISDRPVRTIYNEPDIRRIREFDTFSDPTSYGTQGVRPTYNSTIPRTPRTMYSYPDPSLDDFNTGFRRPASNSYYKNYNINSFR